jgi:hypothetical protein
VTGLDPALRLVSGNGVPRALGDWIRMSEQFPEFPNKASHLIAATVTRFIYGAQDRMPGLTHAEKITVLMRHRESFAFVMNHMGHHVKGVRIHPVLAALTRALATTAITRNDLEAFIHVLNTGQVRDAQDTAAIKLRDWLMQQHNARAGAKAKSVDVYLMTEQALELFIKGAEVTRLRPAKQELYCLPGEGGEDGYTIPKAAAEELDAA